MPVRSKLRELGLGRLLYRCYHKPLKPLHRMLERGPLNVLRATLGIRQMRRMAARLSPPALPCPVGSATVISFMTGARHWHQTVFCARSFEYACGRQFPFEFLDDGSLRPPTVRLLRQLFPHATVTLAPAALAQLGRALPVERFPLLHRARAGQVMMRKLVDLRAGRTGAHLYLDSDMLFFARPAQLLAWLDHPVGNPFLDDSLPAGVAVRDGSLGYVTSQTRLEGYFDHPILSAVNAGVIGFNDATIEWEVLEQACRRLPACWIDHPMLEQTLTALLLKIHETEAVRLPRSEYRCQFFADPPERVPLLHYIYESKDCYAIREWRRWLVDAAALESFRPE